MLATTRTKVAPAKPIDQLAALCKASADPLRLQVLRALRNDSFGVSELCALFGIRQNALSHHLKVLASAGLVATRREGNSIFYRRAELGQQAELEALQQQIFHSVDQFELPVGLRKNLALLQRQREENSRNFFHLNAHKFRQQQDLIASYEQYAQTVAEVLQEAPLTQHRIALEVGPGDGHFLQELAPAFEQVIALDNTSAMLEQARISATEAGLNNIRFIHGDTGSAELEGLQADCVIINMVLHHTTDPRQILLDIAGYLSPDAVVLITDLCRHDQAWARENCGDLWLGFEPQDLTHWAGEAGLKDIASVFLAQRNGFQIQVRLFGQH
ncbi:MAG: ArsR/SmtB family transcription factor [Parahaliea sp.]